MFKLRATAKLNLSVALGIRLGRDSLTRLLKKQSGSTNATTPTNT
jgi:hypothetical protein